MVRHADNAQLRKFMRNVVKQPNGCWLWMGTSGTRDGYGTFIPASGHPKVAAHRWLYEVTTADIPEGMQLGHMCHDVAVANGECAGGMDCRHRRCVNPSHLEPQTPSENTMAQNHHERAVTHCPQGHPYEGDNLIVRADGKRRCRTCDRARKRQP